MTLRSYVGLLRLEDVLRSHKFYLKAASCAISVYIRLYDDPIKDEKQEEQLKLEDLAPNELKKLRNKQRKARRKAELQLAELTAAAEKKEQHNKSQQTANEQENDSIPQDELIPDKLAKVPDPLEQAIKFLRPLQNLASDNLNTHLMAFEIYSRKDKPLLMLQSVKRAYRLDKSHPLVHEAVVRFSKQMSQWELQGCLSSSVSKVIAHQMEPILAGRTPAEINEEFLKENINNLPARLQAARVLYMLDNSKQAEAIKLATSLESSLSGISIQNCVDVMNALKNGDLGQCEEAVNEYKIKCHEKNPLALYFLPPGASNKSNAKLTIDKSDIADQCLENNNSN